MIKGSKASLETRLKQSLAHKDKPKSTEWKIKIGLANKGKHHGSSEWSRKYGFQKGKKAWNKGIKIKDNCIICNKIFEPCSYNGRRKTCSNICRKKLISGDNHYRWKDGITPERLKAYKSQEYIFWRTAVFMRDDYTCQICNKYGGELNADHIKPWALYPELRYAIDNGRTLCIECHRKTDTYGARIFQYIK